jgi:hypothetical protein
MAPCYVASDVRQALLAGGGVHRAQRAGGVGGLGGVVPWWSVLPRCLQVYYSVKNPPSLSHLGATGEGRGDVAAARGFGVGVRWRLWRWRRQSFVGALA